MLKKEKENWVTLFTVGKEVVKDELMKTYGNLLMDF